MHPDTDTPTPPAAAAPAQPGSPQAHDDAIESQAAAVPAGGPLPAWLWVPVGLGALAVGYWVMATFN